MTTTEKITRTLPPPLEPRCPDCSVCSEETHVDADGYFVCEPCNITWPRDDAFDEEGEWLDDTAEQCAATVQPHLDNTWIKADDPRKNQTYRCLLDAGHDDEDAHAGATPHANPEMNCFAKGWR